MATVDDTCGKLTNDSPIAKLEFGPRINTVLATAHKLKIGDLTKLCACGILDIPGIGWSSMMEILDRLLETGFSLNKECQARKSASAHEG